MRRRSPSRLPTFVIIGLRFGTRYLRSRKLRCMVTSIAPIIEQHMPRAQAHAGGQDAHVRLDFVAYLDSSTSTTQLANETHDQSHIEDRKRAGEYCCNQQYSVTAITTSTGTIAERYAYSAYGQPTILDASGSVLSTSSISNRYTYTGREWDATLGLHHFRARWMSPSAGRFLARDPIGFSGSPLTLYDFIRGSPSSGLDPSGNCPGCCCCPASLLSEGIRPIDLHPQFGDTSGVGHFFNILANMNFFRTDDGNKSNCSFQFNEYYLPKGERRYRWHSYPGDEPNYKDFPQGTTMHDWYRFHDEFKKDDFKCGGARSVSIPDYPWERGNYLKWIDPELIFVYFHLTLKSGCNYCEDVEWKGCQVIGFFHGKKIQYFGSSESHCTKERLKEVFENYPFPIPDFPVLN
jgi:RHS repeat-associated protein